MSPNPASTSEGCQKVNVNRRIVTLNSRIRIKERQQIWSASEKTLHCNDFGFVSLARHKTLSEHGRENVTKIDVKTQHL